MRIYITGCAKSGTTLLFRLFAYFRGVRLVTSLDSDGDASMEVDLWNFIGMPDRTVGKRTWRTIFSDELSEDVVEEQARVIGLEGIDIVNIIRAKADVLKSTDGYVSEGRYDACMDQVKRWGHLIRYNVWYEELIDDPDVIQADMAGWLGLKVNHLWSKYPMGWPGERAIGAPKGGDV